MDYRYEKEAALYEDYASGRVLYNARGATAFPVRLASELIQRCFAQLESKGAAGPYSLYDPCCGAGYLLAVAGLMHGSRIRSIRASDIDAAKLEVARGNLSLLTAEGMQRRKAQLEALAAQFGKPSHSEALASLAKLDELRSRSAIDEIDVFQANIAAAGADGSPCARLHGVQIVIADLPYGDLAEWRDAGEDPVRALFDARFPALDREAAVVAVVADKKQKLRHYRYVRLEHMKVGKRQIGLFEPIR